LGARAVFADLLRTPDLDDALHDFSGIVHGGTAGPVDLPWCKIEEPAFPEEKLRYIPVGREEFGIIVFVVPRNSCGIFRKNRYENLPPAQDNLKTRIDSVRFKTAIRIVGRDIRVFFQDNVLPEKRGGSLLCDPKSIAGNKPGNLIYKRNVGIVVEP
jgi:hypothetical protein